MRFIRRAAVLTIAAVTTALLIATFSGPMLASAFVPPGPLPSPIIAGYNHTPGGNDWCVPLCGT